MLPSKDARAIIFLAVIVCLLAVLHGYTIFVTARQGNDLCASQQRTWIVTRDQIHDDATFEPPSALVLKALRLPPYDPDDPLYAEQRQSLQTQERRRLAILGPHPDC